MFHGYPAVVDVGDGKPQSGVVRKPSPLLWTIASPVSHVLTSSPYSGESGARELGPPLVTEGGRDGGVMGSKEVSKAGLTWETWGECA